MAPRSSVHKRSTLARSARYSENISCRLKPWSARSVPCFSAAVSGASASSGASPLDLRFLGGLGLGLFYVEREGREHARRVVSQRRDVHRVAGARMGAGELLELLEDTLLVFPNELREADVVGCPFHLCFSQEGRRDGGIVGWGLAVLEARSIP